MVEGLLYHPQSKVATWEVEVNLYVVSDLVDSRYHPHHTGRN